MTRQRIVLLTILLIAFALRVWRLPDLPPGLWYDEAYNAMDARWPATSGQFPVFFVGNNGREPMWHYLLLLTTSLFGNNVFTPHLQGALVGFITIPIFYRFALLLLTPFIPDRWQRRWVALAAMGWLAVSWWHLLNSRGGLRPVLLPPVLMLGLYFFMKGSSDAEERKSRGAGEQGSRGAALPGGFARARRSGGAGEQGRRGAALPGGFARARRSGGAEEQGSSGAGARGRSGAEEQPFQEASRGRGGAGEQGGKEYSSLVTRHSSLVTRYSSLLPFALAGLFLGLSQYTYLPARLAPLIFGILVLVWSVQIFLNKNIHSSLVTRHSALVTPLWLGLLITILVAGLVFLPLGLFFLNNPDAFSARTGDVMVSMDSAGELISHVGQAVTLFLGAGHELYRHHLPGRAMLGWLEIPFFWIGFILLLRPARLKLRQTQLILLSFGIMWLPALLASPPVHALRPIGLLPFYYLIVILGLFYVLRFTSFTGYSQPHAPRTTHQCEASLWDASLVTHHSSLITFHTLLFLPLLLSLLLNTYDYFYRWAGHPEVYKEYNGPLVDLTDYLRELSQTHDVIIPFHVYAHPTLRYLLLDEFAEHPDPPPASDRPLEMLLVPGAFQLLYVGNIPESPALVLLTRDESGQGAVYVSRPPRAGEQRQINDLLASLETRPFKDRLDRTIAQFVTLPNLPTSQSPIPHLFSSPPLRLIDLTWPGQARLTGYDVTPRLVEPGQPLTINFYWQSLTNKSFDERLFLQLIDSAGRPINQWEGDAFREDMYRWRPEGLLPTQHTLWVGPETPPGAYLVRLGFFDPKTGERLPLSGGGRGAGEPGSRGAEEQRNGGITAPADQVQLGLFYVTADGTDPREPEIPLSATFGDAIELKGITSPHFQPQRDASPSSIFQSSNLPIFQSPNLPISFIWSTLRPTGRPYTVFLQLLNEAGQVVSSWDSQPFNGLYPTNFWSPGEVIADTLVLPLPADGLPPGRYRLITGFYDFETGQRLPVDGGGDFVELAAFEVE